MKKVKERIILKIRQGRKKVKCKTNITNRKVKNIIQTRQDNNSDACVEVIIIHIMILSSHHQGLASLAGFFGNQARNFLLQSTRALV